MSKKIIFIILLLFVLLVGCTINEEIADKNLNNDQVDKGLTIDSNNSNEVETNDSSPQEVENVDLLEYEIVGTLINGEKLHFKSEGSYFKQEYGESIVIQSEKNNLLISRGVPSRPKISPKGDKISFVDYIGFEVKGNLYIYEIESNTLSRITDFISYLDGDDTVKDCEWIDNDNIFLVIGSDTGTITQGGDLYLFNNNLNTIRLIYETNIKEEIVDIVIDNLDVIMTIVYWTDDNYEHYEYREQRYKLNELLDIDNKAI